MRPLLTLLGTIGLGLTLAAPAFAQSPTLDAVRARGAVVCAVNTGLAGFAQADAQGTVRGLDADTCRAVAAAVFRDATRVRFLGATVADALRAVTDRQADLAARNLTQTMTRDTSGGLAAAGVNFFDGQGFLARRAANIGRLADLAGKRVCVPADSSNEIALQDLARRERIALTAVPTPSFAAIRDAYASGACDVVSADLSGLAVLRLTGTTDAAAHVVLPDVISRDPLGPLVRDGDPHWRSLVFWTLNTLLEAEALGINAGNVEAMRASPSPRIRRLLGAEPGLGAPLGLADDWAFQVIRQVGNYAEVFERNLGAGSPVRLQRGLNALYDRGGLMYPIPMR